MTNTTRNRPSISKADKNWYSEEEISIMKKAAFDKGFEHFSESQNKKLFETIHYVQNVATDFFNIAKEECGIEFTQIRLKPVSVKAFELVFIMPEDDFLSKDTYRRITECGFNYIDSLSDDICLTFLYMPFVDSINQNEFLLKGFRFTYDPNRTVNRNG
jgi:hypothetical protein